MTRATRAKGLPIGWQLIVHNVLGSTNAEARRLVTTNDIPEKIVVQAVMQTSGRGRGARIWHSPAGNLHFSVLLRPRVPKAQLALASFVASVAVLEGVAEVAPMLQKRLACKWPNDVLCGGRKLCGILLEGECVEDRPAWVVIGVGINVLLAPAAATLCYPATSLAAEGVNIPVGTVLSSVCHRLAIWLARWQAEGFTSVRSKWLTCATGVGQLMRLHLGHGDFAGVFAGLDQDGALLVEGVAGDRQRVLAGDVFFQ